MKLNTLGTYAKKFERVELLNLANENGETVRQFVSVGAGVFPLDGLPTMDEDSILTLLGVPIGDREDWNAVVYVVNGTWMERMLQDYDETDSEATLCPLTIEAGRYTLRPIYTDAGLMTISETACAVIADEKKNAEYFARHMKERTIIVVKKGYLLIGLFGELTEWERADDVEHILSDVARVAKEIKEREA